MTLVVLVFVCEHCEGSGILGCTWCRWLHWLLDCGKPLIVVFFGLRFSLSVPNFIIHKSSGLHNLQLLN